VNSEHLSYISVKANKISFRSKLEKIRVFVVQQALSVKVCWDSFDRNNEILKNILKLKTTSYPHALYFKGQK